MISGLGLRVLGDRVLRSGVYRVAMATCRILQKGLVDRSGGLWFTGFEPSKVDSRKSVVENRFKLPQSLQNALVKLPVSSFRGFGHLRVLSFKTFGVRGCNVVT